MLEKNLDQKFVFKKQLEDFFETKSWTKNIFLEEKNLKIFFKKVTFFNEKSMKKSDIFSSKNDFFLENFRFSYFFENKIFIEKKVFSKKCSVFIFISYLVPNPRKWHHATPPVPPITAPNASPKIPKSGSEPIVEISDSAL